MHHEGLKDRLKEPFAPCNRMPALKEALDEFPKFEIFSPEKIWCLASAVMNGFPLARILKESIICSTVSLSACSAVMKSKKASNGTWPILLGSIWAIVLCRSASPWKTFFSSKISAIQYQSSILCHTKMCNFSKIT